MKCINHLDKDAVSMCNYCAKSICPECQVVLNQESYCKECSNIKQGGIKKREHSPALAAVLSFFVAGLGQFYNGQAGKGILVFCTSLLFIPWILGIIDAYQTAEKINRGEVVLHKKTGCLISFLVGVVVSWVILFVLLVLLVIRTPDSAKSESIRANHGIGQADNSQLDKK